MAIITLGDLFRYAGDLVVPKNPVSLYRYVEHLVEVAVARRYRLRSALEIGPGRDPIFEYFESDDCETATIVDYHEGILAHCAKSPLVKKDLECILLDIEDAGALEGLGRRWDYIISNGVIEHLRNDGQNVRAMHAVLKPGGVVACITVLHKRLFNEWDHAVGHYRRYSIRELRELFADYSEVQVIQTSLLQELVRPLFFSRIKHLLPNTVEQNNRMFGDSYTNFGRPPYAAIWPLIRYLMPAYLVVDWTLGRFVGGIVLVLARK
jgi:SAM-dependent methyltransferase